MVGAWPQSEEPTVATPTAAIEFENPLDPEEELDFVFEGENLLEEGEQIASGYTLAMSAEGTALGVEIMSGGGRDHERIEANRSIRFWLRVDPLFQGNAAFTGDGAVIPMQITFTTNASPARTRDRLFLVRVAQQGKN